MLIPLFVLGIGAVAAGFLFSKYFIGTAYTPGAPDPYKAFWGKAIFEGSKNHILHDMHKIPGWVGWAPFIAMLIGLIASYYCYILNPGLPTRIANAVPWLYKFLSNKWYFDELYDRLFVRPAHAIGRFLWKKGDGSVIDGTINGTANTVGWVTTKAVKLQTGYVYHYAFWMLIGVAAILTFFVTGGLAR
jgi:NADH-quinone oxidoreductase subunit L